MAKRLSFADRHAAIQFSAQLADSNLWLKSADSLLFSAGKLEPAIESWWEQAASQGGGFQVLSGADCQAPHFVLVAFAIENLFKALLVHRRKADVKGRLHTSLPKFLRTHNLTKLALDLDFPLSISDEDLLFRLSRNSLWAGRYPTPSGPSDTAAVAKLSDGKLYLAAYFAPSDTANLRELSDRIRKFVRAELESAA